MLNICSAFGRLLAGVVIAMAAQSASADWLSTFSADELPTRVLPGSGDASFSCTPGNESGGTAPPTDDLAALRYWTGRAIHDDDLPVWARTWRDALRPLAGFVGRVQASQNGTYRYVPLTDGAVSWLGRTQQSDVQALSLVQELDLWTTRPSTLFLPPSGAALRELQPQIVEAAGLARRGTYISRLKSTSRGAGIRPIFAVSELVHEFFFPQPVFLVPAPTANEMRDRITRAHDRATTAQTRFLEQEGEYSNLKRLDAAVGSIGRPDVQQESDRIKNQRKADIQARLNLEIRAVLQGPHYVGAGSTPPSLLGLAVKAPTPLMDNSEHCGVTAIEARAINFIGELARQQTLTYIARELGTNSLFGADASEADEPTKYALRAFYSEASASLARRAAYEFFWVFSYRLERERGSLRRRMPLVNGSETPATKQAFAAAIVLLDEMARIPAPNELPRLK